jgi:uncharacterized protein involved in exopolysaccharide biosynthesis/Mrp family chromosome partitioning ATPase
MDLLLLAKVLWRKMWILISIPVIAAAAAYLFTINTVDMYRSVAQISTGFTINDQVQLTEEKFNIRDADIKFSNLLNSMNSSVSINLISYRLLLHDLEFPDEAFRTPDIQVFKTTTEEIDRVKTFLRAKLDSLAPLSTSDPEYALVRKFLNAYNYGFVFVRDALTISRVPNTDFIQVDFVSENPRLSALAANSFCEEFIRYYGSIKTERTGESVEFLKQLVDDKKAVLDEKLETQKIFKSDNHLMDVQREGEAKMGQLSELETQRDDIRSRMHKLELTIQRLQDDLNNYGSSTTTVNNQKIIDLRERITRLNERYITGGSSSQVLLDSLNSLREQLRVQMESSSRKLPSQTPVVSIADIESRLKDAEIEYKVERSSLAHTEAKIRGLQYSFSGYASKEAKLGAIQKEVDLASQEYLDAVNKFNEAKNRLLSASSLRQVTVAIPPLSPESSKRILIIALAAFSSLAICLFVIVSLELLDFSIRTPEKFKRIVGLHMAGTLNKIDSKNFNIRNVFSQTSTNEETEMYKSLLRKLRHEVENMNGKVLLFTSPKKKDGKTFTMFSLSYVLSLINKRVLIIDTNFKNNSLSQILVKPQTEIKVIEGRKARLLIGSAKKKNENGDDDNDFETENTYDLINPTKYKNIFIVGNAGGGNESPAEILSGRDFNNLIAVLVDSFDYILMEGAALNDYSDTKELVKYADKVIAVFSAESAVKQLDKDSIAYFKSLGKKFGGAILNRVDTKDLKL